MPKVDATGATMYTPPVHIASMGVTLTWRRVVRGSWSECVTIEWRNPATDAHWECTFSHIVDRKPIMTAKTDAIEVAAAIITDSMVARWP